MYLKKIEIQNYRLWKHSEIELEPESTVIVGKNNTGKTSFIDFIQLIVNDKNKKLSFDDYPLSERNTLYSTIKNYLEDTISFEDLSNFFILPSIKMHVDYSLEKDDDPLENLSPFIIDTDDSITEALIDAEYNFIGSKEQFDIIFPKSIKDEDEPIKKIRNIIEKVFSSLIKLNIYAVNPKNEEKRRKVDYKEFENLFPLFAIKAERHMDESEVLNETPLKKIVSSIFQPELDKASEDINEKKEELKKYCEEINFTAENQVNNLLKIIVENSLQFGYPSAEDHNLFAKSNIDLQDQIQKSVDLYYKSNGTDEILPSGYNGLGYKNLIKIELELLSFKDEIEDCIGKSIPLIFIEEPESHMHPQMQQKFIEYIDEFTRKISDNKKIQIIITTHSSHIVNSTEFEKIRYITKNQGIVKVKNLTDFCNTNASDKEFLEKYLTLNKCDLFFADKAILIEGTAERLLIPNIIEKMDVNKLFNTEKITLKSQYYTLIEVGGAYAYRFIPFMKFLDIPTLIITDIDSVGDDGKKCFVSKGTKTSNATIKHWFKDMLQKTEYTFDDIKILNDSYKTIDNIHLEYQVEENGLCGRSLEEAIKNANRDLFKLDKTPTESDIDFDSSIDGSKTDFAMDLIFDENKQNYKVPKYIENGLIWLNSQLNGR